MNVEALKSVLNSYCATSGQMVSVEKSSIFFSPNIKLENKVQICTIMNIMTEALNDKYLGLRANVGMDKNDCFQFLIGRIIMKISGWKENKNLLEERYFFSNMLFKLFQLMPCPSLKFIKNVKESLKRWRIFGGVTRITRKGCIGW